MKIIDKSVYSFSKNHSPIIDANPEELLLFKTIDCFSGRIQTESDLVENMDYSIANPAAGPVYINGAEPGDILVVDLLDITVANQGVICTSAGIGPLSDDMEIRTRVVKIDGQTGMFKDLPFHLDPMVGVIGTAPDGDDVVNGYPGNHGGNLDSRLMKKGSRLYLPVRVAGALLQMGDIHAAMGDAELCGTGVEVAGEILVKTSLIKQVELNWPVTETSTHWYVHACADDYNQALVHASRELQRLLMNVTGWDKTDAYMYMSIQCNVEVNQACKPCEVPLIIRFGLPKLPQFKPLISY